MNPWLKALLIGAWLFALTCFVLAHSGCSESTQAQTSHETLIQIDDYWVPIWQDAQIQGCYPYSAEPTPSPTP